MASKTDKNTVKTVPEIPDTLAEFVEQHEELAGCPEFVPAHEFSVAQTCDFMVVDAVASDSYGVFRKKTSDDVDSSLAIAGWWLPAIVSSRRSPRTLTPTTSGSLAGLRLSWCRCSRCLTHFMARPWENPKRQGRLPEMQSRAYV